VGAKREKTCFGEHSNQFTKEYRNDVQNMGNIGKIGGFSEYRILTQNIG